VTIYDLRGLPPAHTATSSPITPTPRSINELHRQSRTQQYRGKGPIDRPSRGEKSPTQENNVQIVTKTPQNTQVPPRQV
jgi:hypothetical protein